MSNARERRKCFPSFLRLCLALLVGLCALSLCAAPAKAQSFRFSLRADPDVIPANGISTTSILVQVQNTGSTAIAAAPLVRFVTTGGTIERQAQLSGGVARVLLRSSTTPGTALVTAFVNNAREQVSVEFSNDDVGLARYMDVSASYIAYGADAGTATASGRCSWTFGETHIESDVRLDLDLNRDYLWAEGNAGNVLIRQGSGKNAHELRGDRLFYDIRHRRGVMRRGDSTLGPPRQEFIGSDFRPLPVGEHDDGPGVGGVADVGTVATATQAQPEKPIIDTTTSPAAPLLDPPGTADSTRNSTAADAPRNANPDDQATAGEPSEKSPVGDSPINGSPSGAGVQLSSGAQPGSKTGVVLVRPGSATNPSHDGTMAATNYKIVPREKAIMPSTGPGTTATGITSPESAAAADGEKPSSLVSVIAPDGETLGKISSDATTNSSALRVPTEDNPGTSEPAPQAPPAYRPLEMAPSQSVQIMEPLPPQSDIGQGYWVSAHVLRVFPHDKVQFERATLFLNGGKVFSMPRYVVPLNGSFNPGQDILGFNSASGVTLNFPYYYQASAHGQGTLYFQHAPGGGFAAEKPGFALAVKQEYWLSRNSSGSLIVDQIGHDWNLNLEHKLQLSPTTSASMSLDMPEHRDAYLRSSLLKDFSTMQVGIESFYSRPRSGQSDFQGQFFARLRPRNLGSSRWSYTVSANSALWQRYPELITVDGSGSGGGIGLPGRPRTGTLTTATQYRAVTSQTLDFSLQGPQYRLWKGGSLNATLRATAYNQSLGRRGASPGFLFSFGQNFGKLGSLQLDYSYDKSGGLFAGSDLTHLISGSLSLVPLRRLALNGYATQSLSDHSFYGSASFDYQIAAKWRAGLFSDYSSFAGGDSLLDYGWTLGRTIGQRELTLNYSRLRNRIYFELGGFQL